MLRSIDVSMPTVLEKQGLVLSGESESISRSEHLPSQNAPNTWTFLKRKVSFFILPQVV